MNDVPVRQSSASGGSDEDFLARGSGGHRMPGNNGSMIPIQGGVQISYIAGTIM